MTRVCIVTRNARDAMKSPKDPTTRASEAPERRSGARRRAWRFGYV